MMPLSKAGGGRDDKRSIISSGSRLVRSRSWRKVEPVKLLKTRRITEPTARTNQSHGVTILNRTKFRIKNDTTTMISNLAGREKLQVKLRYMRNRWHMKTGSVKSALTNNRMRSTIGSLNRHRRMKRTQRIKISRIMCHVKRSSRIKDPRWLGT
jgi:hypothetical protein